METSEEKSLPATPKKLADARKKGKLAKSADAVNAANLAVVIVVLAAFGALMVGSVNDLVDVALHEASRTAASDVSFSRYGEQLGTMAGAIVVALAIALGPLALAVTASGIVSNIVLNKGFLFTFEALNFSLESLNPVAGFKRIFGKRGLFEFLKAVVKLALLGVVVTFAILWSLNSLVWLPSCGFGCVLETAQMPLLIVLAAALLLFIIAGGIDIILQRQLFLDEMKMTKTEFKKERKEQEGDPIIKGARRRLAREAANESFPLGAKAASLFIHGPEGTVGLRYVPSESRVPIVVARAEGDASIRLFAAARDTDAPILTEPKLALALATNGRLGKPIPNQYFHDVAKALWITGIARKKS